MYKLKFWVSSFNPPKISKGKSAIVAAVILIASSSFVLLTRVSAQKSVNLQTTAVPFKVGEKLTYNISFGKFNNAAYAEIYAASRGKLSNLDAVELRGKVKTNDLVSAAFYLLDESRQTFASVENGHPLYVRKTVNSGVLPEETITNYLSARTESYDLLSLIYSLRYFGAEGIYPLTEDGKNYTINFQTVGAEDVRTDAGQYETTISSVTSDYLTEKGFSGVRVNFSKGDQKIPVVIRLKTSKGEFRASLASIQTIEGGFSAETPTPTPILTPRLPNTPKPAPTATPYIENQPLTSDFPFKIGETLEYQISSNLQPIGNIVLQATERRQFAAQDSLLLTATVTSTSPGNRLFNLGDGVRTNVNPDFLTPQQSIFRFTGTLNFLNQTSQFDQKNGAVTFNGTSRIEVPVNTHSLLSLIYAIRAFNLKPSKDPSNPVNDTRVAVFYDNQPYVFTLRPSTADLINLQGEKTSAQLITINTGNPQLDALGIRLWLSNDEKRLPLRLTIGNYQADLTLESNLFKKDN